jgi:hypothetical protein
MKKRELRRFRKASGRALRRLERLGEITSAERVTLLAKLADDKEAEIMCKVCCEAAVSDGLLTKKQVAKGKFVAIGEGIDWDKCLEFFMKILPMFL